MKFKPNPSSSNKKMLDKEKLNPRAEMHSFHRYYGKLIPAIPSAFIKKYSKPGDYIFDPFTGSGTTAVESLRNNRNFIGYEINPLSAKIAEVKTSKLKTDKLEFYNNKIIALIENKKFDVSEKDLPFLINRDHWFKDFVQTDLIIIQKAIEKCFANCKKSELKYKDFYLMTISAILRNVSNADTRHVFPGISKRMRKLDAEGKIHIDVFSTFKRAIKKRAQYYSIYDGINTKAKIINSDSANANFSKYEGLIDLIVTNPPYISSVRYIETMKLEMYWLEYIKNQEQYSALAHKMLGNDKLLKAEYKELEYTNFREINVLINKMDKLDRKSAKIIGEFFNLMEKVIYNMSVVLKKGGKVVIKISDSKIKKIKVETGKYMTLIANKYGFVLKDVFIDKIDENHRSLTTARNTYSDIITQDYIIVWEKK